MITHDSSYSHVRGKSEFIDDRPVSSDELLVDFYYSTIACGKVLSIDTKDAIVLPDVVGIYTGSDLPSNAWGPVFKDQPLLVDKNIAHHSEPIAMIVAKNQQAISLARKKIKVRTKSENPVFSIEEALEKGLTLFPEMKITSGDFLKSYSLCKEHIEGEFESDGQDHFYLESQASIAYLEDGDKIRVVSSSQNPTEVQHVVAHALNLPLSSVVCEVKRMGGGFGGKETQAAHFAALTAFAAKKTGKSVRFVMSKDHDMLTTGKRHPFKTFYKAGFSSQGKIESLSVKIVANGGAYNDLSMAIVQRAMLHIENAYYIPNTEIIGVAVKTNLPSNTAFRGFGAPQGVAVIEDIIEKIAYKLGLDPVVVRKRNLYSSESELTPYGESVKNNTLPDVIDNLLKNSDYFSRKELIEKNNKTDPLFISGIALTPIKFGISFTSSFLNQGNALVNVHLDGTVQVSTGATEMGQGVNARIAKIVADVFAIPYESVRVMTTSTEKNHNTSPTAASSGTDINGSAAELAAKKIKDRLDEFKKSLPDKSISFGALVQAAYMNRISLGDYAFYKTPGVHFDKEKGKGAPFLYYTIGAAVSEVKIDRFTGEAKVVASDILMDLGKPIIEDLEKGQIAGAFIQGMGWVTNEKLIWNEQGALLSHSPTTYKIPNVKDTPTRFNIDLFPNEKNLTNVRGYKAVGEPPFVLALSVWHAIKHALRTIDSNVENLPIPATYEDILSRLP